MKILKTIKVTAATCDEMLDAFNQRINELTGTNSSTTIESATVADMPDAFNNKIDELENLNSATTIQSATRPEDEVSRDEEYVNHLMNKVDKEMNKYFADNNITSWNWNTLDDGSLSLIVVFNDDQIDEYTIPKDDISGDVDADAAAIIQAVGVGQTADVVDDDFYDVDHVESCNSVMTATDIEQVEITSVDDETCYIDTNGVFGSVGECISLAEIKEYWNNNHLSDPSLVVYPNFDAWFADTAQWLSEEGDEGILSSTETAEHSEGYQYVLRHGLGPGTIPNDVQIIDNHEDGYKDVVTLDRMLTPEEMDEYDITYPN